MRSTMSNTSPPSCSRTVSPSMRPSRRMSSRSGASFGSSSRGARLARGRLGGLRSSSGGSWLFRASRHGRLPISRQGAGQGHVCAAHHARDASQAPRRLSCKRRAKAARARRRGPSARIRGSTSARQPCAASASQAGRVAGAIASDLGAPIGRRWSAGHARAARAIVAMPEAAVHENREPPPAVDDVRLARQIGAIEPIARRDRAQQLAHGEFRPGVARFDRAHDRGALGRRLSDRPLHAAHARALRISRRRLRRAGSAPRYAPARCRTTGTTTPSPTR